MTSSYQWNDNNQISQFRNTEHKVTWLYKPVIRGFWLDESRPLKCQAAFRSGLFHYDVAARFPSDEQGRLHAQSYKICSGMKYTFEYSFTIKYLLIIKNDHYGFHLICSWKTLWTSTWKFREVNLFLLDFVSSKSWKNRVNFTLVPSRILLEIRISLDFVSFCTVAEAQFVSCNYDNTNHQLITLVMNIKEFLVF